MKSTSKNGPSTNSNGLRGAGERDESSVLFSLHALMAKGDEEAKSSARRDESGLIDIKALAAAAAKEPSQTKTASPPEVHVDVFPFGAPAAAPPIHAVPPVEAIDTPIAQKTSRRGLLIAGALLIGVAAAAIGVTLSAPGTPALAAADNVGVVAENARQGTAAIPPPVAEPAQPEAKSPAPPQTQTQTQRAQRTPGPTPTTPQPTPTVKRAETKPPAADPCGGDLMCAMRRAAQKR